MTGMAPGPIIDGVGKTSSRIAFGTSGCGVERQEEWHELLDIFAEAGGAMIDTARGYGTSEEMVGAWLEMRGRRDETIVQTKCGLTPECVLPDEDLADVIREEVAQSLAALRTDYIDVLMVHRDNQMKPVGEILEPLNEALDDGVVHAIAASNWEYRRLEEAREYADRRGLRTFAVVSNNISLAVPMAAFLPGQVSTDRNRGEDWHRSTGVPLVPWSSQARGFFVGRHPREMRDNPPADLRWFDTQMLRIYGSDENYRRYDRAKRLGAEKGGYTAVEVALAWLLHRDLAIIPVVGPKAPDEVRSCIKALSLDLTEEDVRHLDLRD